MSTTGIPQRSEGESARENVAPARPKRKRRTVARGDVATPASVDPESARVAEAMKRIGSTLAGKWRLHILLGVGGMAAVYGATHRNGNRVAIKLLHPAMAHDRVVRERFLREGYVANRVDHEGVVRVLDDDELEDGAAFLVMELLTGETLETRWQRAGMRLPLVEVLGVADELLGVLGAAHEKNVQHRDVKPENVFLTRKGQLKILDFGIARMRDDLAGSVTATQTGLALGTPAFMPPEQALGKSDQTDARSDLWAVAATMFTLLSGRFVHLAESPSEMVVKAATERAPALASVIPHVPPCVAAIVDRALSFEREGRFSDAAAMRTAVRSARVELGYLDAPEGADEARGGNDSPPHAERLTLPSPPAARAALAARTSEAGPSRPSASASSSRSSFAPWLVFAAAALSLFVAPAPSPGGGASLAAESWAPFALTEASVAADPVAGESAEISSSSAPAASPSPPRAAVASAGKRPLPPSSPRKLVAKRAVSWVGYRH